MKKLTKLLCLILALVLATAAFASCKSKKTDDNTTTTDAGDVTTEAPPTPMTAPDAEQYTAKSTEIYNAVLGEFKTAYDAAKEAATVSEKFALMAVAEAKLLEAGVMLPTTTQGGRYAISRVAPNTITSVLWGNDSDRYHDALVVTNPIKSEDRTDLKELWAAKKGTGTFLAEAKKMLADKGYTLKDNYTLFYTSDPKTWDTFATSRAADAEAIVNTYDGLYEYDVENEQKPALAESYTVSDDGLTYTFKIRQGYKWVDSQGNPVADVKADDFVAGMQHMMDAQGGLEYLVEGIIVNASEYIGKKITDFSQVGVKATDDSTLVYTLEAPCTYFMTMLGYSIFAPMSRSYYESKGGKFGADYNASAADYNYGKTKDDIAYCGPYVVTNATDKNTIVFSANDKYWNKDNINLKKITWLYTDNEDVTRAYNEMKKGTIDGCSLNDSTLKLAKQDKADGDKTWFDTYHYVSSTNATSYMAFLNINRYAYTNFNDISKVVSTMTQAQRDVEHAAMLNQHFRLALMHCIDRAAYNAVDVGEDLKLTSLRNSYTPGTFVTLEEEVTIKINGTDTKYPAGTFYGKIMQDQIDADGYKMKVWDAEADGGIGSGDGFDGWYNVEEAKKELNLAITELAEKGITVSKESPIVIDYPYFSGNDVYTNKANVFKQSLEKALDGKVVLNLVACAVSDDWLNAGYYFETGYEANYDINDLSGWGPDYGDPSTYLDTFLPDYAGYMVKSLGIF